MRSQKSCKVKNILILGAGYSATVMIEYLLKKAQEYNWQVTVGDISEELAVKKIAGNPHGRAIKFDINNEEQKQSEINNADVVISFLPSFMHLLVAQECLRKSKHLLTASYISQDMKALSSDVKNKGLLFLNEMGVDPGIDHMSAMQVIDNLKSRGCRILGFTSNTGGLIAPESDNNPWNYKFTWSVRNVVLAGQGTAKYIEKGRLKYLPYNQLFVRTRKTSVPDYGEFDYYPNRDSLSYRSIYGLDDIQTLIRGTFRRPGYCQAWNVFVQLGITDDSYQFETRPGLTYRDFINSFLPYSNTLNVEDKLCRLLNLEPNGEIMNKLKWLGIFEDIPVGLNSGTPAQILQKLLEEKWKLETGDKDMIVMQHKFEYEESGSVREITSSMVVTGKDENHTAMAVTVGMPVALAAEMLLKNEIKLTGVHIPVFPELYNPVLSKLENYGVKFFEETRVIENTCS